MNIIKKLLLILPIIIGSANAQDELPPVGGCNSCIPLINVWINSSFTAVSGNIVSITTTNLQGSQCYLNTIDPDCTICTPDLYQGQSTPKNAACQARIETRITLSDNGFRPWPWPEYYIKYHPITRTVNLTGKVGFVFDPTAQKYLPTSENCCSKIDKCTPLIHYPDYWIWDFYTIGGVPIRYIREKPSFPNTFSGVPFEYTACCSSISFKAFEIAPETNLNDIFTIAVVKMHCTSCSGGDPEIHPEIWESIRCQ